jgi:hypothetical protein
MNHIGLDELAIQEGIRKPWETLLMMTKTPYGLYAFTHKDLEHFAALVAAHERKAFIETIEPYLIPVGNSRSGELACEWNVRTAKEKNT